MFKRFLLAILVLTSVTSFAQLGRPANLVSVDVMPSVEKIVQGEEFRLAIMLDIKDGFHINSNKPLSEFFIPTESSFEPAPGMSFGQSRFPEAERKSFSFSDEKVAVYEGRVVIFTSVSTSPQLELSPQTLQGTVSYQGCDDNVCYAPEEQSFEVTLNVVPAGTIVEPLHQDLFELDHADADDYIENGDFTRDELRAKEILERGLIYALLAFFVVGLALNLTPCVYPVIPITVSYFSAQSGKSRGSSFVNALFYQVGIAIAFAILGLISGLAGKQWGFLFQSPWFVVAISLIILSMAASLFGAFEITVPGWLMNRVGKNREGTIGSLVMGLTVGVVIAPCAAGIIIGLVGLIAKLGLVVKGTLLFFVMGLGLGVPYLFLATFSGLLNKLPQSGMWMVWVRKVFGIMLVGVAIYFIIPQLDRIYDKLGFLLGLLTIFGGLLLGFLDHSPGYTKMFKRGRAVFGIILIILGFVWTQTAIQSKASQIEWAHYEDQSIEQFIDNERPIFIDFYADWCAPCKQLDRVTFRDDDVNDMAKKFTMLKVDCTAPGEDVRGFMEKFDVTGMPTLVFLSKSGKQLDALREVGFIGPSEFLESMQKALEAE